MKIFTLDHAKMLGYTLDASPHASMQVEAEDVSDSYHTMSELYEHRMALNVALFNVLLQTYRVFGNVEVMKSRLHNDGTMFKDYFIVFAQTPYGQISYHYDLRHWDLFKIPEVDKIPFEYDGHTSKDVIERLLKL